MRNSRKICLLSVYFAPRLCEGSATAKVYLRGATVALLEMGKTEARGNTAPCLRFSRVGIWEPGFQQMQSDSKALVRPRHGSHEIWCFCGCGEVQVKSINTQAQGAERSVGCSHREMQSSRSAQPWELEVLSYAFK